MATLVLVQHGQALPKDVDPDRPLDDAGRAAVGRVAAFLAQAGLRADRVLHSGKTRAAQTAEILAESLAGGVPPEARDGLGPKDDPAPVAEEAAGWSSDVVIAGHMPFVQRLASLLCAADADAGVVDFQPGTAVGLRHDPEGGWAVAWMVGPAVLTGGTSARAGS
ncbi:MAG: phosphohistidine phosphatase SixA [Myxococcota bacterium]|nr:phosphohistidine phosphatase SixA [Myxococcota bacterium]